MSELILETIEGPEASRQVQLTRALEAGRSADVDLTLGDEQASRHHPHRTVGRRRRGVQPRFEQRRDAAAVGADYAALAALVDTNVKRQTGVAVFAMLSAAGLAVLIYFGVT
jgi:hypothetical protein